MEGWLIVNKVKEVLKIKKRYYKCEYCGCYSRSDIREITVHKNKKIYFCCEGCEKLYNVKTIVNSIFGAPYK